MWLKIQAILIIPPNQYKNEALILSYLALCNSMFRELDHREIAFTNGLLDIVEPNSYGLISITSHSHRHISYKRAKIRGRKL